MELRSRAQYLSKHILCFSCTPLQCFSSQIQGFYCYCFPGLLGTQIPENRATKALATDPLVMETPQKFFLRMKQKLQQQRTGTWYRSEKHLKTFLRFSTSALADLPRAAAEHCSFFVVCSRGKRRKKPALLPLPGWPWQSSGFI